MMVSRRVAISLRSASLRLGLLGLLTISGLALAGTADAESSDAIDQHFRGPGSLDTARFVFEGPAETAGSSIPGPDVAGSTVSLPHYWPLDRPGERAIGWYRVSFEYPGSHDALLGVFLPRVESNASVFVNGHWIGAAGAPGSLHWNQPLYFPFSADLLSPGSNTIDIRVEAYGTPGSGLRAIAVDADSILEPIWQSRWWFQVGVTEVGTILALFSALLFGAIWLGKSRDAVYGWCSLAAICWGINSLNYHVQDIPLPYWGWKWLVHAGLDLFATTTAFLILRLVDVRLPRTERCILAFAALAVTVPILAPRELFFPLANGFHGGSLALGMLAACWLVRYRKRLHRYEFGTFLVLAFVVNGFLIRDYAIQVGWLDSDSPRLFHLTAPALFLSYAITLLVRFIVTYRRAEQSNVELEERVQQKQEELEHHYARLSELEQLQAVSHERERIMREMHDGMGAHLVSALSMVEEELDDSPEVASALRSSLDEMRLVIYSLDATARDITALLGTLRERLEPALHRAGIRFRWRVTDLPPVERLGSEHYLHILRIIQEAITNVLKHSGATLITVTTAVLSDPTERERISIRIEDDGVGIAPDSKRGYGTRNMAYRAKALDGEVETVTRDPGTLVDLRFPISLD